jgi:Na+-driven multidrug efflux pump
MYNGPSEENISMKRLFISLKSINYRLFFAILVLMFFPTIYQTVRIYFLGAMPGDWGFNIASQLSWVNLFYEVIQEAIILPLFYVLGKSCTKKEEFENKVKTGLLSTGIIYSVVSMVLIIFTKQLVVFMAQKNELIELTVNYIRLETIAALLATLFKFMYAVLVILKKDLYLYVTLGIQMLLSILLDTFLISDLNISLKIGVNGIAISNIIVNLINLAICILLLRRESINILSKVKYSFAWVKDWFAVGKYSGIESFVRNLAFMIMIIRMMNLVSEQGNYWIANNFIWQWLLLPTLALGDLVKQEIGENGTYRENITNKLPGYMGLCVIFSILFLVTIPFWKPFLHYIMNVSNYETVYYIAILQTAFYITFIFNNTIDSVFYGVGRTDYMLWQSLIVNIVLNGGTFVLYLYGIFVPTLFSITILFGIGLFFDFIPTMALYIRMLHKMGIKFNEK